MEKPVTMKVVAERAGVTQATVSMSLAHNPRIPEATRRRIQELAKELGYRPNPYVSTLMRARRQGREHEERPVIALVNGYASPEAWRESSSATVRQMRAGAIEGAAARGYRAEEFWLYQDGMTAQRFSEVLHARGIHGVLLGPLAIDAPPPEMLWQYFAAVRLGVPLPALTLTTVCNDHFFSSIQLMRECWRLGYRRPGLVMLDAHAARFQGRWDGGLLVTKKLLPGTKPVRPLLLKSWDDLSPLAGWLERAKPDVLISPSINLIQPHLVGKGWPVPKKLGLASLSCAAVGDEVSGIYQNGALIGATGIDMVISMLERNERGLPQQARTVMLEGIWNPGRTLRQVGRRQ